MKHLPVIACFLSGLALTLPCLAQPTPSLSYIQPLSPQSVQAVQDRLRQAGAYTGAVDGAWGPDSAAALQRFQQSHQLQVTGQLNQATAATLGLDLATLVSLAPGPVSPPVPSGSALTAASIRAVQTRLHALNFYTGTLDGVWGESTQAAIERFQQGRGLQPNGQLNPATISAMGLTPDALTFR